MKSSKLLNIKRIICVNLILMSLISCGTLSKQDVGVLVGGAAGAVGGAVLGNNLGDGDNTALGAVIGGVVGATAGGVIGANMDKQAKKIEEELPSVEIERHQEEIFIVFDQSNGVYFDTNQHALNDTSKETMKKLAGVISEYPYTNIRIEGHTDNVGKEEANLLLSTKRAESVKDYLISQGLDAARFTVESHGESKPKYSNDDPEGREKNRRVEITISPSEASSNQAIKETDN